MKKKKNLLIIPGVIIIVIVSILYVFLFGGSSDKISTSKQKEINEAIATFDVDTLSDYTEDGVTIDMPPTGESSQMGSGVSDSEELVEYKEVYDEELAIYNNFYEENTAITTGDIVYNETEKRYEQKVTINSYSIMGYSIIFNDLMLFYIEALSKYYEENNMELTDMTLEIFTPIKVLALKYTNDYFSNEEERFEKEVTLIWEKDENGKWKCEDLGAEINSLLDPEKISEPENGEDVTVKFDKYHAIAVDIWESIIFDEDWNVANPLAVMQK